VSKIKNLVIVQPTAKNAKKKLLKNEKKIQEYVRTRLPARLRRSDGYLFGQVAILPFKTTRISGSFSNFHHLLLKNNNFASFAPPACKTYGLEAPLR